MQVNRSLAQSVRELMPGKRNNGPNDRPVSFWKEMDRISGKPEKTAVVIFRTRGCSWYNFSSCSMCGYFNDVSDSVTAADLRKQVDFVLDQIDDIKSIKVFTSGSFLDPLEVPPEVRNYFMETVGERISRVLIESRTEYLTGRNLEGIGRYAGTTRIAIGVESTDDSIIANSINKGTSYNKFLDAATTARKMGFETRSYLLLKPPFISELSAIRDVVRSVSMVSAYSNDVSINPMNIQRNTLVEKLWKNGQYRPPRLWSLADAILQSTDFGTEVVSYPTAGNRERGVHNDEPDANLLELIVQASLNQDFGELKRYFEGADLSAYRQELEAEAAQPYQVDFHRMANKISSGSFFI